MSVRPMNVLRIVCKNGGFHNCIASNAHVTENTINTIGITARRRGQTNAAARHQKTTYITPPALLLNHADAGPE